MNDVPRLGRHAPGAMYSDGGYLEHNQDWHAADAPWKANKINAMLRANNVSFSSMCEIGCGSGRILDWFANRNADARFVGYELSPQAYELCLQCDAANLSFVNGSAFGDARSFDVALCVDVFEHVDDYVGFVREIAAKAPLVVFHIPLDLSVNAMLRPGSFDRARREVGHIHYFSRETARATLKAAGYEIVDEVYTAKAIDLPSPRLGSRFLKIPRNVGRALFPDATARILGGFSLLVLTRRAYG